MKPWDGIIPKEEQDAYRAVGFGRQNPPLARPIAELDQAPFVQPHDRHTALLGGVDDAAGAWPQADALGQRPGGCVAVGRGLVVEATRLGLEHLGQCGCLGRLLLGLAAQLVGHLLGMQQQLRSRRTVRRLVTGLAARVWVDRLHSVHQVLVRRISPPTGSVPRRLAYPRSILPDRPGV